VRLGSAAVTKRYLVFRVGDGQYGILLDDVVKVIRFENVTDVPTAPPYVEGVLNLGGDVVPVVNLRSRFSHFRENLTREHRVIVVARDQKRFGLLVDAVREILELDDENVVTEAAPGIRQEFVVGIAKVQDSLLVLLDIFRVLSAPAEAAIWAG
jgi:purine-binding chemotaxis protein CheW